jgi:hypothetical protein
MLAFHPLCHHAVVDSNHQRKAHRRKAHRRKLNVVAVFLPSSKRQPATAENIGLAAWTVIVHFSSSLMKILAIHRSDNLIHHPSLFLRRGHI